MSLSGTANRPGLWAYNYDFEFELAGEPRVFRDQTSFHPWYFLNRSWHVLLPLAKPCDTILTYETPQEEVIEALEAKLDPLPSFRIFQPPRESNALFADIVESSVHFPASDSLQLHPWGWSPAATTCADSCGLIKPPAATPDIISWINAKPTSHRLRKECLPPSYQIPGDIIGRESVIQQGLKATIAAFLQQHGSAFVKHPFGTAGRLADRCHTAHLTRRRLKRWEHWLRKSGALLLEQAVDIVQEWSIQLVFQADTPPTALVLTRLFSGIHGHYNGTIITENDQPELAAHLADFEPLLKKIQAAGFIGPLGVDLIETSDGRRRLLEINGRITMGRVALEWHRTLPGFEVSLFTNQFFARCPPQSRSLYHRVCDIINREHAATTLLNLVQDSSAGGMMVSLLLQGSSPEWLRKKAERIRKQLHGMLEKI